MKEDICSIPINEIFAVTEGCPICRMRRELEERALEFVTGAAMMEPDVRHETNRLGFCPAHLHTLCERPNRLPLALVLESHLITVDELVFRKNASGPLRGETKAAGGAAREAARIGASCYVCDRMARSLDKQLNTFFVLWKTAPEFRAQVEAQSGFCLADYALLLQKGEAVLGKKDFPAFTQAVGKVTRAGLSRLTEDVTAFCKMYDYHNNGADFGPLRGAVRRAAAFLGVPEEK